MSEFAFTQQQQRVLTLLAQGSTVSAAAETAGVHRNTIANWRRAGSPAFKHAWQTAQWEQAAYWRDQMQSLGNLAIDALRTTLTDERTTPSVRLRAALAVLDKISKTAPAEPARSRKSIAREADEETDRMISEIMHIPAQWKEDLPSQTQQNTEIPSQDVHCAPAADVAQSCTMPGSQTRLELDADEDEDGDDESITAEERAEVLEHFERFNRAHDAHMAAQRAQNTA